MSEIVNSLTKLFSTYGFKAGCIIVCVIILVNIIKKPITKKALKLSESLGYDKSIVTRYISLMPVGVAFVLTAAIELICQKFSFSAVSWKDVVANSVLYSAIAVALYETIKKQLQAYAAKSQYRVKSDKDTYEKNAMAENLEVEKEKNNEEMIIYEENENVEVL